MIQIVFKDTIVLCIPVILFINNICLSIKSTY